MRPTSTVVSFWIGAAVLLLVVGTPLVTGNLPLFAFALTPALLLTWLLWFVLYRPAVHYDTTELVIVNIGRIHTIPWARVSRLRQGLNLAVTLDSARTINAWGVPAPARPGNIVSNFDRRSRIPYDVDRNVEVLDGFRVAGQPSDSAVVSSWDVLPLSIGAVLIVVVVIQFALGL